MRHKHKLPNSKKAAHILRPGTLHYVDVLAAKERPCRQTEKRVRTSTELLDCMDNKWKLCRGTSDKSKSVKELALTNLTDLGNRGKFKGNCHNCRKKGHKSKDCSLPQKERNEGKKNNATNYCGDVNKNHCDNRGCYGHTKAECFRMKENSW